MNRIKIYNRRKNPITRLLTVNTGLLLITLALFSLVPVAQAQSPVARVSIAHVDTKAQSSGQVDVSAFVSVTDETGQPISGLTAGDFILTENDQRIKTQSLSVTPATNSLTAVLLIDAGARMADVGPDRVRTIDAAKDASVRFIEALTDGDLVGVYAYDQQLRPLQDITYDHNFAIDRGVSNLDASSSESSCLYDALFQVSSQLAQDASDTPAAVVVITGSPAAAAANACGGATVDDLLRVSTPTGNPIPIFSVGVGNAVDQDNLTTISNQTGGQSFIADDTTALSGYVSTISRQLKNQYEISYTTGLNDVLAKIAVVERDSQQSDRYNVQIPKAVIPTATPAPPFSINLTVEQSSNNQLIVKADVPGEVNLKQSQLFINNNLVQRTVTPPFGRFEIGLNELGSGKHNIRVKATDANGVESAAEVDLTLTLPPTPVPTAAPVVTEPEAAAAADTDASTSLVGGVEVPDTIPTGALAFVIAGVVILVGGTLALVIFMVVRSRRPKTPAVPSAYPPVSYNALDSIPNGGDRTLIDEEAFEVPGGGDRTLIDEEPFDVPGGDRTLIDEEPFDVPGGDRTLIEDDAFEPQDADRTYIEQGVFDDFDPERTFIREEIPVPIKAKLVAIRGEFMLTQPEFELSSGETTIGRNSSKGAGNDIAISDRETSRKHAKIICRAGSYYIQDLNSSTGTKLNGEKLQALEELLLTHDAEVAVGPNITFKFDFAAAPTPDATIFEADQSAATDADDSDDRTIFEITEEEERA